MISNSGYLFLVPAPLPQFYATVKSDMTGKCSEVHNFLLLKVGVIIQPNPAWATRSASKMPMGKRKYPHLGRVSKSGYTVEPIETPQRGIKVDCNTLSLSNRPGVRSIEAPIREVEIKIFGRIKNATSNGNWMDRAQLILFFCMRN